MSNNWPCKLHEHDCPCRGKNCTQGHPGTCVYYDKSPPGPISSPPSYYHSGAVHGMGADSVAADILQYVESDISEHGYDGDYLDGIGWGGGEY